ncbi:MAG: hypothetical protein ACLUVC_03625 [Longibaculum sp.]
MKLERVISEILFNDIDPQYIIDCLIYNKINVHLIDFQTFYRSSIDRFQENSKDEIEIIYNSLKLKKLNFDDPASFFEYLGRFSSTLLVYNEFEPKIKYEKLMRWNKISHLLGQDILTMSYLAYHDYNYNDWTNFFAYKSIISTDNRQLYNILQQGIAENHFHLKGSTQIFCLNWLSLMNHPFSRDEDFKHLNVMLKPYYKNDYKNDYKMKDMIKLATILRMYFFVRTNNYAKESNGEKSYNRNLINLDILYKDLKNLDKNMVFVKYLNLFEASKSKFNFKANSDLDYALNYGIEEINSKTNYSLVGERRLLYLSMRMMLSHKFTLLESQFFYLYILIKNNFRREIIQVNSLYGFSNFSDYETRKEIFIDNYEKYKKALLKMAIDDTFNNQNIISLEARIVPKKSVIDNIKYIDTIDKICNDRKDKIFYVFHFVKKKDNKKENSFECRNYDVRKEIEYQSKCIAKCLESNFNFRERVRGIDACNNEFFCRPEVFGQCFRFLSKFHVRKSGVEKQSAIDIFKTYHVGEDFLDIADGLRAIDEAIVFCNLERGSRLGHATVLGVDVEDYYTNKNRIIMSKLDFVDNIVWVFKKAEQFNINLSNYPCCKDLLTRCYSVMDEIYISLSEKSDLDDYYNSWLLRGDNPYCYNFDGSKVNDTPLTRFERCNYNGMIFDESRSTSAIKLYYAYHFDSELKKRGQEIYDFKIVKDYIQLIKVIQKEMCFEIARKGIFIECNPTSNYLIAHLGKYEKHPIVNFYNDELYNGQDKECAQLNVSINTDDQGVFDTSLENEYALMAYALEYCSDENGYLYNPNQVYKWIDSVRKMGIQQKFK